MRYNTCTNCAVDAAACEVRQKIRSAIAGLHVQSITFTCAARKPMFHPGQRVSFKWSLWDSDDYGNASELPLIFTGTVVREVKTKFVVQVDNDMDKSGEEIGASDVFKKNDALLIKVRPADMVAVDEPDRRVCQTCYWVQGVSGPRCYADEWYHNPSGCIIPERFGSVDP